MKMLQLIIIFIAALSFTIILHAEENRRYEQQAQLFICGLGLGVFYGSKKVSDVLFKKIKENRELILKCDKYIQKRIYEKLREEGISDSVLAKNVDEITNFKINFLKI